MNKKADFSLSGLGELILAAIILFIVYNATVYILDWYSSGDECDNKAVIRDLYNLIQDLESKKIQSADLTNVYNRECYITTFSQDQSYNQIKPPKNDFKSPFICLCNLDSDECTIDNSESCIELKTFTQINNVQFKTEGLDTYISLNFKREDTKLIITQQGSNVLDKTTQMVDTQTIKTDKCGVASVGSIELKSLLDVIAWAEGADYNVMFGGKTFSDFSAHPAYTGEMPSNGFSFSGGSSTAAGRYQFLKGTYDGEKSIGFFSNGFTPEEQDKAAIDLITRKRKLTEEQLKKAIEDKDFIPVWDKLAPEWASLPYSKNDCPKTNCGNGKSYYGQPVRTKEQLNALYYQCYNLLKENKPEPLII